MPILKNYDFPPKVILHRKNKLYYWGSLKLAGKSAGQVYFLY
jgi:hypothetical protein